MEFEFYNTQFSDPEKRIFDSQGTLDFQKSLAMFRIQYHLQKYINLCQGQQIPESMPISPFTSFVCEILSNLSTLIDETPAERTHSRFGNLSYRDWQAKFENKLDGWVVELLPVEYHRCIIELKYYILNSFGSKERIDYGTGPVSYTHLDVYKRQR